MFSHCKALTERDQRRRVGSGLETLKHKNLYENYLLARRTGKLQRFIIFGSYVTTKPEPNDIDIILIMRDDFLLPECDEETSPVFYHLQAQAKLGASVFWTSPSGILLETVDQFIAHWQITRDQSRHGIVEVSWERES
jgi:hypothetical protein